MLRASRKRCRHTRDASPLPLTPRYAMPLYDAPCQRARSRFARAHYARCRLMLMLLITAFFSYAVAIAAVFTMLLRQPLDVFSYSARTCRCYAIRFRHYFEAVCFDIFRCRFACCARYFRCRVSDFARHCCFSFRCHRCFLLSLLMPHAVAVILRRFTLPNYFTLHMLRHCLRYAARHADVAATMPIRL